MALGSLRGFVEQGGQTVTTDGRVSSTFVQRSFPSATVTILNAGTLVAATIFSDSIGTPKANPFVADSDGEWDFWAASGSYDIQFSGQGITTPFTLFGFFIPDPAVTAPLPDPGANGYLVRTALQTVVARTLTGTANEIAVSNGNGTGGNSVFSLPATLAFAGKTISGGAYTPTTIVGGTHTSVTSFSIRSSGAAFDLALQSTEVLTANRALTITVNDSARTITLGGNLTLANAFVTAGAFSLTLTQTGATNVTLPTTGTLATLAGVETFTNKTITNGKFNDILDTNGNVILRLSATAVAVNSVRVINNIAGQGVTVDCFGSDPNIKLTLASKGTEAVVIQSNTGTDRITLHGSAAELYLGDGITSATPDTFTINSTGASGNNVAGSNLVLASGKATGSAIPGVVAVRYPLITASGTTLQSLSANSYPIDTNLVTNTNTGTAIANTVTETSLFASGLTIAGSNTLEGGFHRVGTQYKLRIVGNIQTTGTPTLRVRAKLGATVIADTTAATMTTVAGKFWLELDVSILTLGATGTVNGFLRFDFSSANTGIVTMATLNGATGATVIDLTASQVLDVTIQWGTANPSNTIQVFDLNLSRHR